MNTPSESVHPAFMDPGSRPGRRTAEQPTPSSPAEYALSFCRKARRREDAAAAIKFELASSSGFWIAAVIGENGPMPIVYYPAIIERSRRGHSAFFPDLPGCTSAGDTLAEAAINAEEALAGHLLVSEEHGGELAAPSELLAVEVDPSVDEVARILLQATIPQTWPRRDRGSQSQHFQAKGGLSALDKCDRSPVRRA